MIIDFDSKYSQLIARRIREENVYCEVVPFSKALSRIKETKPQGIVLSDGLNSILDHKTPALEPKVFECGIPIFAIGYGMQLMGQILGGENCEALNIKSPRTRLETVGGSDLFRGIEEATFELDKGSVLWKLPEGFHTIASGEKVPHVAIENTDRRLYGVLFRPELESMSEGQTIIRNFLFEICNLKGLWDMDIFIDNMVEKIRRQVGNEKVICGLSGGVDSAVTALLVHKAVGDQLVCIYVDHGFMRQNETTEVVETFRDRFNLNLVHVDARKRFLGLLKGVKDPEKKRKIIGTEFIRVFEEEAVKLGEAKFLAQGTVYPDVIESGTQTAAKIKSHHNVGGLPEDMEFQLIEPLRELFKDEARKVGEKLGMPEEMVWRHPFPGPGLAIRIMGEITEEKLDVLKNADAIYIDELKKCGLYNDIWQAFCVLSDTRTVGVMDGERTYAYMLGIRAVNSTDGMTAKWFRFPYDALEAVSNRIMNEVPQVNRVVYDISTKPPSTIEWE